MYVQVPMLLKHTCIDLLGSVLCSPEARKSYKYLALPAQEGLQRLLENGVGVSHKPAGPCHFIAAHQAPLPQRTTQKRELAEAP